LLIVLGGCLLVCAGIVVLVSAFFSDPTPLRWLYPPSPREAGQSFLWWSAAYVGAIGLLTSAANQRRVSNSAIVVAIVLSVAGLLAPALSAAFLARFSWVQTVPGNWIARFVVAPSTLLGVVLALRERNSSWGSLLLVTPSLYLLWGVTAIEYVSVPQFLWLFAFCAAIAYVLVWFQHEPRPQTAWAAVAAFLFGAISFLWFSGWTISLHRQLCTMTGR